MKVWDKRIFRCANGHEYESKEPITTVIGASLYNNCDLLGLFRKIKANDRCKFCGAQIIAEYDYKDGKIVAGAILHPAFRKK